MARTCRARETCQVRWRENLTGLPPRIKIAHSFSILIRAAGDLRQWGKLARANVCITSLWCKNRMGKPKWRDKWGKNGRD
jgi:hypothetical protein